MNTNLKDKAYMAAQPRSQDRTADISALKRQIAEIVGYFPSLYLDPIFPEAPNAQTGTVRNGLFLVESSGHPRSEVWLSERGDFVEVYRDDKWLEVRSEDKDIATILRNHGGLNGVTTLIGDALDELGGRATRVPPRNRDGRQLPPAAG